MKAISEIRRSRGRTVPKGEKTRDQILETAVHVASAEGLEGLTIGRLADELGLSKSGLFAHFGSKEELQIAVIGKARDIFVREVVEPAHAAERGISRLIAMLDEWIGYVGRGVFRGGCFFMACAIEFDSRPGQVRNLIAELSKSWLEAFQTEIEFARSNGELDRRVDSAQLAFELHALAHEANWAYQLFRDERIFERARSGIGLRLQAVVTNAGLRQLRGRRPSIAKSTVKRRPLKTVRKSARGRTKAGG
jgi:AcrR family transcriptional regulator